MAERPPDRPAQEQISFVGGSAATLSGILHRPVERARGSILLAHCFTCSKDIHTMTRLANAFSDAGFAAFRFMGFGPCGLIGHSLGGAAALLAAEKLKTVRAIATIGAPSNANHVRHLFASDEPELLSEGEADVTIGGRTFTLQAGFVHDLANHDVLAAVAALGRPYLVVHADDDTTVPVTEGEALFGAAVEPRDFIRYADGGHLFGPRNLADRMTADVVNWFGEKL